MPRNGAGTYSLPAGNPVTAGTTITSSWANATLPDIATEITNSLPRNGEAPPTANLPMGGYKLTGLADGSGDGDSMAYGQDFSAQTVIATGASYARTLAAMALDVVSPKSWYDLVVGGDWAAAINAAIAACPVNGTVRLDGSMTIGSTITIGRDDIKIIGPAKLTAKASTNFEYMMLATSRTNVTVENIVFDANKSNRSSGQNVRFMTLGFASCTECLAENVTAYNTRGYSSVPAVGICISGTSYRCRINNCIAAYCGDTGHESDGFYASGDSNLISNSVAILCLDTGFVIESSKASGIVGCVSRTCSAGAAITNASSTDVYGNYISGLTVYDWNSAVTGGIQIGCPLNTSTGVLYDTSISNVTMYANTSIAGSGPAINIRKTGTPKATRVNISGVKIHGATTQGIVADGDYVSITGCNVSGTTNACYQFADGTTGGFISGCVGVGGQYGVMAVGNSSVTASNNLFINQTQYGLFALNTATLDDVMNIVKNPSVGYSSKDAGATINHIGKILNGLSVNNAAGSATSGSVVNKFVVYDKAGNSLGYVPVYNS